MDKLLSGCKTSRGVIAGFSYLQKQKDQQNLRIRQFDDGSNGWTFKNISSLLIETQHKFRYMDDYKTTSIITKKHQ